MSDTSPSFTRLEIAERVQDEFHEWAKPIIEDFKNGNPAYILSAVQLDKLAQIMTAANLAKAIRDAQQ